MAEDMESQLIVYKASTAVAALSCGQEVTEVIGSLVRALQSFTAGVIAV